MNPIQLRIKNSQFIIPLGMTFGGRAAGLLLALVGNILSAQALGPADFGRFGLLMSTVSICGTLADAGLSYTAIKLIAQHHAHDPARAHAVGRIYFILRLLGGSVLALLGVLLAEPVAVFVLGRAELTPHLQLAFWVLFGVGVSSYPGTVLLGLAQYGRLGVAAVLNAIITLAGIALLFVLGRLTLETLVAWNVALPVLSALPAWALLPAGWRPWRSEAQGGGRVAVWSGEAAKEVLKFSPWLGLSNLGSVVAAQIDMVLLGRLTSDPSAVGIYSVALTLAARLDTLNQSMITVMLPRASRLEGQAEISLYTRRTLRGSLGLALVLGVLALGAQPLIPLLYGERYAASAPLFLALLAVALFDLATGALFLVALPLNRPRVLAAADWLRVGAVGVGGWLLIPPFGGYGAAAARGVSRVVGVVYTFAALREKKRA